LIAKKRLGRAVIVKRLCFTQIIDNNELLQVTIRGAADDVKKARSLLLQYAEEREQSSFTAEIRIKVTHHRYLIGKGGGKMKRIRETGARIIFPSEQDEDRETITIIGKKEVKYEHYYTNTAFCVKIERPLLFDLGVRVRSLHSLHPRVPRPEK
jgi:KH domain.